MVESNNNEAS
jgi:hypothetical protein